MFGRLKSEPRNAVLFGLAGVLIGLATSGCRGRGDTQAKSSSVVSCNLTAGERATLVDVAVNPRTCAQQACPRGSFCDQDHDNTCSWNCLADSDCGSPGGGVLAVCTCDGVCSNVAAPPPAQPAEAICPRSAERLDEITTKPEPCKFDDTCPYGAYCNHKTGTCARDCSDPTPACATGQTCDCYGRCVVAGAADRRPLTRLPQLVLDPPSLTIPGDASNPDWTRTVEVMLQTKDEDLLGGSGADRTFVAPVSIHAGANLQVACPTAGANAHSPFADGCGLSDGPADVWTFRKVGDTWFARRRIWISRKSGGPGVMGPPESWVVSVESSLVAGSPRGLPVTFDPTSGGRPNWVDTPAISQRVLYSGKVTIRSPASLGQTPVTGSVPQLDVPVVAAMSPSCSTGGACLVLIDPTRTLAPQETLVVPLTGSAGTQIQWIAPTSGVDVTGGVPATIVSTAYSRQNVTGEVSGTLSFRAEIDGKTDPSLPYALEYELTPTLTTKSCTNDAGCSAGSSCVLGHCSQPACVADGDCAAGQGCVYGVCSASVVAPAGTGQSNLLFGPYFSWLTAGASFVTKVATVANVVDGHLDSFWFHDLYGAQTGVGSQYAPYGNHLLDPGALAEAARGTALKTSVCQDGFGAFVDHVSLGLSGFGLAGPDVTNGGVRYFAGSPAFGSPTAVCKPENIPVGAIACVSREPHAGQNNSLDLIDYGDLAYCDSILANIRRSGDLTDPGDFTTECTRAPYQNVLQFTGPYGFEQHDIWFCAGWSGVFTYPNSGRSLIDRRLAFKQAPGDGGGVFHSAALALTPACAVSQLAPFSGDPVVCGSEQPMGGVTLLSHPDQTNPPKSAAELLADCMQEIRRTPPFFSGHTYAVTSPVASQDVDTFFAPGSCFEPAQFYGALEQAGIAVDETPTDLDLQRFKLRLLQQWVELHSFMAQQGMEVERLARTDAASSSIINQFSTPATTSPTNLDELLRRVEEGWALVVQMAGRDRAFDAPAAVIRSPDYRPAAVHSDNPSARSQLFVGTPHADDDYEQRYGLAPTLMEGLTAHMKLLTAHMQNLSESLYAGPGADVGAAARGAMERFGASMRYALAVEEISTKLFSNAFGSLPDCTAADQAVTCASFDPAECSDQTHKCLPPVGAARWTEARAAYLEARSAALAAAVTLRSGRNPLNVDEDDLPLFFGDLTGTNSRFFASSDYLMNTWAISAVATARGALSDSREAWIAQRDSKIKDELNDNDRSRRLEAIVNQYGTALGAACGLDGELSSAQVFDKMTRGDIGLDTCYIDRSRDDCQHEALPTDDSAELNAAIDQCKDDTRKLDWDLQLIQSDPCFKYFEHYPDRNKGPVQLRLSDPEMKAARNKHDCNQQWLDVSSGNWGLCVRDVGGPLQQVVDRACDFTKYTQQKIALRDQTRSGAQSVDDYCAGVAEQSKVRNLVASPLPGTCYRGELGTAVVKAVAAQQDVGLALIAWQDIEREYEIQARYCNHLDAVADVAIDADNRFKAVMDSLIEARHEAEIEGMFVGGFVSSISNGVQAFATTGNPYVALAVAGATAVGSVATGLSTNQINKIDDSMEKAEIAHANFMHSLEVRETSYACMVEAEKVRIQFDGVRNIVTRRATDAFAAAAQIEDVRNKAKRTLEDGKTAYAREQARTVGSYSFHYWYDEKVDRFKREFDWAKRLTYLTLRAVEYEFQQSFPLRGSILAATHPDQLETALQSMQTELATRTINRRRPEESSIVLSLRDDILAIPNRSQAPLGDRVLSASETFRSRLWDDQFAIRDAKGGWLGQGVRFTLGPQGALLNRCAERLWRVTATIQGDGLSEVEPGAPVALLKRNTFSSQWCADHGNDAMTSMQIGAVQPSQNLFRGDQVPQAGETQAYSTASLYPWFNIRRSDFFKIQYQEGASDELAGRGLYGDYVLLFPRELLEGSRMVGPATGETGTGPRVEKFPLSHVEDVLLRFDYLSVDNLSTVRK